jgi:hypothetical protein
MRAHRLVMLAVAFDLGHRKIIGLGAGIVIGAFLLATSAAMPPALPQLGGPASFDAGYLEPAVFIDDSLHAARQDAQRRAIRKHHRYLACNRPCCREAFSHDDVKIILQNLLPKERPCGRGSACGWPVADTNNRRLALVRDLERVGSIPQFVLERGARRFVGVL